MISSEQHVQNQVRLSFQLGYRLLDTASGYFNEEQIGKAIIQSELNREEIFITSKMRISEQGYDNTLKAFEKSLVSLGVEYLDLYMLHWPIPNKYLETYKAVERLYSEGLVKSIGISNFQIKHFEILLKKCSILPSVNQIELHPYLTQKELIKYYSKFNIKIEGYSPLAIGKVLDDKLLNNIAFTHKKTVSQIVLRWHLQNGVIPIPKAITLSHLAENIDIFDFVLSNDEMHKIDSLDKGLRTCVYPDILKGDYN